MTLRTCVTVLAIAALLCACGGRAPASETPASSSGGYTPGPRIYETLPGPCQEQWVHMPMVISFPYHGVDVDDDARGILAEVVRSLETRDDVVRIRVEGHIAVCPAEMGLDHLGEQRAASVAAALADLGVPAEMIETVNYASSMPRAGKQGCDGGSNFNSRVELSVLICERDED